MRRLALYALTLLAAGQAAYADTSRELEDASGRTVTVTDASRIVAAGGAITETLYALDEQQRLVGVDTTSQWPPPARELPEIGYMRTLGAEGILSLAPTLLLASENAGPPEVLAKLERAGVAVLRVPAGPSLDAAMHGLRLVAEAVGRDEAGRELAADVRREVAAVRDSLPPPASRPRVLFVMGGSSGMPLVAGGATKADTMIRLAGGRNVVTDYDGYRPLGREAVVALAPDVVLAPDHAVEAFGGRQDLLDAIGLGETSGKRAPLLVVMDGLTLLGMGPRTGAAVRDLAAALRPDP